MGNRIALWDNLKFFLVTCVVIGHFADQFTDLSKIYDSIFLFIYSFHIPLFIFIAGLMFKNKNITAKTIFFMTNALGNPTRYEVYHYEIPFLDLKECDFKGMKVKVPENTQEYLRTLYGEDFETPNTNYNWKENPIYKPGDAELAEVILHKGK